MLNGKIQRYFRHGTLTRLRVFEAVVRHGNSTRAAEALHMAQPTVSVHLRKLTDTIGVTLLEHVGKKVRLTAAGEEVYAACQRLFQTLSELDEAIADIRGLKAGKLRIATTTAGEYLLPPLLAEFVKRHPAIEVSLHVTSREAVLERLSRDTDDVYLLTNAPENNAIAAHAILPNPLIALAPAGHPLGDEKNIPFERFAKEPLLVRDQGSGTRLAVDRLFAEHELQPLVRMELGSNEAIKEAITAGLGVSLMYRYACGFDIDNGLALLDVRGLPRDGSWQFVQPVAKRLSFVAQTFLEFARKEARRIFAARAAQ
ncbi:MAG: LysR family transcriptional regulator [Betaproteobacteria bacterium]|nr:LysR family transcriptional regulator [Betaproteobacteria bacterium]